MTDADTQRRRSHAGTFRDKVDGLPAVIEASVDADRFPPLVTVLVSGDRITAGVHDLLDQYQAEIEDVRYDGAGLALTVSVPEPWKDAGSRTIREHGNSLVLTLPHEALDAASLGEQRVDLHARDGEIHVKSHDGGLRFP